jgi:hypothetical protein
MNTPTSKVLSGYKDIANYLGVSIRTLYRHIKFLPVSRLGGKIVILESDLVGWVEIKTLANLKKALLVRPTKLSPFKSKKD